MTIEPASLLPPASTALERALEMVAARGVADLDAPVATLWNPATCPLPLLPWLAWGLSIDRWNENWSEAEKRSATANAIEAQRRKGTPASVRSLLSAYHPLLTLVEWFQTAPQGDPHTFEIRLPGEDGLNGAARTALANDVLRDIELVKPVRSHFRFVQFAEGETAIRAIAPARTASSARLDGPAVEAPPLDWNNFLQTEDGEPISDEAGVFLEVV